MFDIKKFIEEKTKKKAQVEKTDQIKKDEEEVYDNPWKSLLIKLGIIIVLVVIALTYVGGIHVIHDNYMYPKVGDGDLVITYKLNQLYSGDVIVYEVDGKEYIGRVVAVGGDTINFTETGYTVNGLNPYEVIYYKTEKLPSDTLDYPYTLNDDEVYVLCDYREQGNDSRAFGPITKIKGKVVLLLRGRGF